MRPRKSEHDLPTINAFKIHKVLTIAALCALLQLSIATVRRRLKEWDALSSYNNSGRYYTLPSIPQFNKKGLWEYQGALFSKHGTLINTIIHFVRSSKRGLSNSELEEILGVNPNSYLPQYAQSPGVKREKHKRHMVYFSADQESYKRQRHNRIPPESTAVKLPPDAISIIILVGLAKNPEAAPLQLSQMLRRDGHEIGADIIDNLFEHHGLKKKPSTSD